MCQKYDAVPNINFEKVDFIDIPLLRRNSPAQVQRLGKLCSQFAFLLSYLLTFPFLHEFDDAIVIKSRQLKNSRNSTILNSLMALQKLKFIQKH